MKFESIFDIIGHIMVGPSSSHTAGACYISYIAQMIFGDKIKKATLLLHGSFAETYKGHGTDKALIGGLMGFKPDDERLREALKIADEINFNYLFERVDLGPDYHPNTVKIILESEDPSARMSIVGSSVGGGNILIKEIDGLEAGFNADYPTLICFNRDTIGVVAKITKRIADHGYNIANMKVSRSIGINKALCWVEVANKNIDLDLIQDIESIDEVYRGRFFNV